eukprot:m.83147 g.83147  ORF g.83147 m.83147 type:complete len:125 (-) comp21102_c0_seq1:1313-1687(-)
MNRTSRTTLSSSSPIPFPVYSLFLFLLSLLSLSLSLLPLSPALLSSNLPRQRLQNQHFLVPIVPVQQYPFITIISIIIMVVPPRPSRHVVIMMGDAPTFRQVKLLQFGQVNRKYNPRYQRHNEG